MKKFLTSAVLIFASTPVFAVDATPFFSVYAGAGSWAAEVSGDLGDSNTDVNDLGLDEESNGYLYIAFEHAVPLIPNVRLERSSVTSSGTGTLSDFFQFGGQDFNADVTSEIDITMTDAVLYYEIALVDFGLTFRQFDAEVSAVGTVDGGGAAPVTESEKVDGVLPMLYAQTKIDLPFTGVYVTGNANVISIDDKSIVDYRAAVGYGIEIPVVAEIGLELGYRAFEIDLGDDEDFAGNVEFSGVYFGANVKF
ncbi:MAG: TIGR04219 family outer membrane beta-barrel protein [Agarilytica sp.]